MAIFSRFLMHITAKLGLKPRENIISIHVWQPLEIRVTTHTEYRIVPEDEL
jgi:hypothetical protein